MKSYKATCPICGHDSFYITPDNGMGYCFRPECKHTEFNGKAQRKQRVRSDNVVEIRAVYKELAWYYHGALDSRARKYLHKRGFTDKTIEDLQIGYCPTGTLPLYRDPIAKEAGLSTAKNEAFLGDRITFPYFKDKNTVTDIRGRAIDANEELKYKSPFGDGVFRGAIYPYNYHLRQNTHIIIAEAEIKADIAYQLGYAAMGIPGIGSWRTGFVQEDRQRVTIVFDNESNPETQKSVIAAVKKVAGQLIKPYIAVLPIFEGEKKAEIDVFILQHGGELFASIVDNALDYKTWTALQTF
jgi:DNA primase (bacterial type)